MDRRRYRTPTRSTAALVHAAIAAACTLLPAAAFGQAIPATPAAALTPTNPRAVAPLPGDPTNFELPYHALACHGGPLLSLSLNGKPDQWFLADTGIGTTWLNAGMAERLKLTASPYVVDGKAVTDGAGKPLNTTNVKLTMGSLTFPIDMLLDTGWVGLIYADIDAAERLERGSRLVNGIIGTNILRYYGVAIDPSQQEIHLSSGDITDNYLRSLGFTGGVSSGLPITIDPTFGTPIVAVTIDEMPKQDSPATPDTSTKPGAAKANAPATDAAAPASEPILMVLDTGAFQTCVPAAVAARFKGKPIIQLPYAAAPGGGPIDIHTQTTIRLGPAKLDGFVVGVSATDSTAPSAKVGILGMDFLSHYRVMIDFPKQRLYLEPLPSIARYDNPSLRENATRYINGHILQPTPSGDWFLRVIPANSRFARLGIRPTDRLVTVDGTAVAGKPSIVVASLLMTARDIVISRYGRRYDITEAATIALGVADTDSATAAPAAAATTAQPASIPSSPASKP